MAWLGDLQVLRARLKQASRCILQRKAVPESTVKNSAVVRCMSHGPRKMYIFPSAWSWHQMKNEIHFYAWLGLAPVFLFWSYFNFFVGEAELSEIPEGYIPEDYEYYKHPITRWMVKNFYYTKQEMYEKRLAYLHETTLLDLIGRDQRLMDRLMREKHDFIGWYYRPITNKYAEMFYEESGSLDALNKEQTGLISGGAM